ncbi:PREDICTED: uncharacterized protein LOC106116934 [Papilio xuthus]|uniref:Uncharacterized protein LOC106116934 n=1 Tax=Papilio xuthus TaxID=66420 RepID=A0AAJ6Z6T6_PAPXU|nr:PREDICTED: uncharacterized protein LOC106116934 [Papilio xuthus]
MSQYQINLANLSVVQTGHNVGYSKKESHLKSSKSARTRSDIFENLFIIYDATFLSLVWSKIINGVHVNVDHGCWNDLSALYKALVEGRAWAYNTVDASGRYQSGFFQGNRLWLGSKDECFRLDQKYKSNAELHHGNGFVRRERDFNDHSHVWPSYDGKGALTQTSSDDIPTHRLAYVTVQISLNITKFQVPKLYDIVLGLCLPRSCSPEDVESLVKFSIMLNDNLKSNGTIPRTVKITSLRHIEENYDVKYDTGAVLLILVTIILLALAIIATIVDYGFINCIKSQTGMLTIDKYKYDLNKERYDEQIHKQCELVKVFVDLKREKSTNNKENIKLNKDILQTMNTEAMKKSVKGNGAPTLDVMTTERQLASCKRCGKYRKQNEPPKHMATLPTCPRQYKTCASLTNTEYRKRDSLFLNLLLSFSLKHNCKSIFNTTMANQDLAVVHLLRIFSTFWIIFIHVCMLVSYLTENTNSNGWMGSYPILTTGTLAFDTLIFASGIFSAHHFFYLSSRYTLRELVSCGGNCGKLFQFVCFVTNRAVRLLPPYAYTIFLTAVLSRVSRDTQPVTFPEQDHNCDVNWWRNLLYITLFYPQEKQCMQICWYLSTETSLHACGALLCAVLVRRRRSALLLLNLVLLAAVGSDVFTAFADYHRRYSNVFEAYYYIINRPLSRAAPYLVGVLAGWMIHKADGRISVSRMTRCCLWCASVSAAVTSAVTSESVRHWACAWLHVTWPLALLWPALVCSTDHAAWSRVVVSCGGVAALSRLSYSALLVHGAAARWLVLRAAPALCTHTACIWSYFAGTLMVSVAGALVLALLLELPACCLLRRICDYAYS